jgi:hypothetical protein
MQLARYRSLTKILDSRGIAPRIFSSFIGKSFLYVLYSQIRQLKATLMHFLPLSLQAFNSHKIAL